MIQTTKDILFLVLGISILVISFFFSLFLYYLIKVISGLNQSIKSIGKTTHRVEEITGTIKEKISAFSFMPLLAEGVKVAIDFLKEKKKKAKKIAEDEE